MDAPKGWIGNFRNGRAGPEKRKRKDGIMHIYKEGDRRVGVESRNSETNNTYDIYNGNPENGAPK